MAGINNLPSAFTLPAIPVQSDMSAIILGGGNPLLPMEFLPPILPGFGGGPSAIGAPAPAEAPKETKKGKKSKKKDKAPKAGALPQNSLLAQLGWEVDKKGLLKLSEKGRKDYVNGVIGNYLQGAQQLNMGFASLLGAPF